MPTSNLILSLKQWCKSRAQIHQVHAQAITTGLFSLYPSPLLSHILRSFISRNTTAPSNYDIIYISKIFNLMPNPSNFDYNNIIKAHTLLHSPHTALILFLEMRRRPIAPDSHTFNFVLGACGLLQNSHSLAKALHAQLTKFGFLDNVYVHSTLCCTYGRFGDVDGAEGVFEGSSFRNMVSYSVMIDAFFKAGEFDRARELFDEMPHSFRDVVSYTAMLKGLAMHGHGGAVLEQYLSRMLEDGVKPNGRTILAVLVGCSHSGLINDAKRIFMKMESVYGVPREIKHYGCMVDVLARAGLIKEAREMIEEMPMAGDAYVWGALLGGCKIHGDVEVAEEAAKHLLQAKPKDGGVYSALAHIYSNLGQWDDVVKVQRLKDRQETDRFVAKSSIIN